MSSPSSSFQWSDLLTLAQQLRGAPEDSITEARLRCAVSRAYYHCYHLARQWLELNDSGWEGALQSSPEWSQVASAGLHKQLWHYLQWVCDVPGCSPSDAGARGAAAHAIRVRADYHDRFENARGQMGKVLVLAREIASSLGITPPAVPPDCAVG